LVQRGMEVIPVESVEWAQSLEVQPVGSNAADERRAFVFGML
jgi:hypothetical protein